MKLAKLNTFRRLIAVLVLLSGLSMAAFAAQTLITAQTPLGPYPGTVSAGQLALTFTAADTVNGNSFALTGHEILVVWNSSATVVGTVTITSVSDQYGRTQDVTAYSLPISSYAAFSFRGGTGGWKQADGTVHISASAATIQFAVIYAQ